MNIKLKAQLYVLITVVTGSLIPILVKFANNTNMYEFFMLTAFVSTAVSLAFIFLLRNTEAFYSVIRNRRMLAISVMVGLLVFLPIEFGIAYAERYVSASLATVIFRMSPLLMLPLLPLVLREKLTKYQVLALSLAFFGIYVGVTGGSLTSIFSGANLFGIALLVALAAIYALATVLIKKYLVDMASLLAIAAVSLSVIFTALYLAGGATVGALTPQIILAILFLGIGSNVLFYYMYFVGLRILKTTFVTNLICVSPFLTLVFANLLLGEQIKLYYVAIAIFAAVGILIQSADKLGGAYLPKKQNKLRDFLIFDVSGAFANTGELAIASALSKGGRVLALKLDGKHRDSVRDLVASGNHTSVFTDEHKGILQESEFVREILGAGAGEMVVMRAGDIGESESFFEALSERVQTAKQM